MKLISFIFLALGSLTVSGQTHLIGLKSGVSLTNITYPDITDEYKTKAGFIGGVTYEHLSTTSLISLNGDIQFDQRGSNYKTSYFDRKVTWGFRYNYLSIAIKAGFKTKRSIYYFGHLGLRYSNLISARFSQPTFDNPVTPTAIIGTSKVNATDEVMNNSDFALLFEIGWGWKPQRKYRVFMSITAQSSFTKTQHVNYFPRDGILHNGIAVFLGVQYGLKKR